MEPFLRPPINRSTSSQSSEGGVGSADQIPVRRDKRLLGGFLTGSFEAGVLGLGLGEWMSVGDKGRLSLLFRDGAM